MKKAKGQGKETERLLQLLEEKQNLDGEALARLLALQKLDKLKLIAENTIDVICLHHPADGQYLYASPSTERIMGYTPDDLKGKVPFDFIHPEQYSKLLKNVSNSSVGFSSMPKKLELKFRTKHFGYQWFEGYTKPIFDKKGNVLLVLSCTRNIQDRKLAELERKEKEIIQQNLLLSSILFEKKKHIIKTIEHRILEVEPDTRKELRSILSHIQETMNLDEDWEDFMMHYKKVHPDFYSKLSTHYPNLSQKDMKHLAFIKIGMTSSDVSSIMMIKKESLRVVRNRLKKKLGLSTSEDLITFIQHL